MPEGLPFYKFTERLLTVAFIMAEGNEDNKLSPEEFWRQCHTFGVFKMNDQKFAQFKAEKLDPAGIAKRGSLWKQQK